MDNFSFESLIRQAERTAIAIALVPEFKKIDQESKQQQTSRPINQNISHKWTGRGCKI